MLSLEFVPVLGGLLKILLDGLEDLLTSRNRLFKVLNHNLAFLSLLLCLLSLSVKPVVEGIKLLFERGVHF